MASYDMAMAIRIYRVLTLGALMFVWAFITLGNVMFVARFGASLYMLYALRHPSILPDEVGRCRSTLSNQR